MGRPDQTHQSPVFNAQVAHEQPNGVPIGRPGQPTYNSGAMRNQQNGVPMTGAVNNQPSNWTSGLFDCMNDGENGNFCF